MAFHAGVQALFDWMVDGAAGAPTPMAVVDRVGDELLKAGLPVERIAAFVRTLHPSIMGRRFVWDSDTKKTQVSEASWELLNSPMFKGGPLQLAFETGLAARYRLASDLTLTNSDLLELREKGFTELAVFPFKFMGGSTHGITFATKQPGGFTDEQHAALAHVVRPLTRVAETLALMRTAVNVLNAYVGNDAGDRILKGQIQRGDTELINCVIWFSDLRGFTTLSGTRTPKEIIAVLNEFFECQVPAIESEKGQVLKFIGDGLLAIFPVKGDAREVGEAAVRATTRAFDALQGLNTKRQERGDGPLSFGVALHLGEVAYGNVGGSARLDFTAIGPSVNLASRIESMTGKLGKTVLLSDTLAKELTVPVKSVGLHELKGIAAPVELFELGG